MLIAKARTARPTHIRRGHSVNGALSIIKPSFCGFREQCVTSVSKLFPFNEVIHVLRTYT